MHNPARDVMKLDARNAPDMPVIEVKKDIRKTTPGGTIAKVSTPDTEKWM